MPLISSVASKQLTVNDPYQHKERIVVRLGSLPAAACSRGSGPYNTNEGSALTISFNTTNISAGTVLRWRILDRPEDFSINTGLFTITGNTSTFVIIPIADQVTEGSETFRIQVEKLSGSVMLVTPDYTINNDTTSGDQIYTGSTGGGATTYTWICPVGVTSVSVVCVGGGGAAASTITNPGNNNAARGAGGGGLGWKNDIAVIPGNSYTVQVGNGGTGATAAGTSFFISEATVAGRGGQSPLSGGAGGTFVGDGGGNGGAGGTGVNPADYSTTSTQFGGGGGAGGYSGNGGTGGNASNGSGSAGSGGGGGGGGAWTNNGVGFGAAGGGGVGRNGVGSNGTGGPGGTGPDQGPTVGGGGGSGGANGNSAANGGGNPYGANGGSYGGGACSGGVGSGYSHGGEGVVRIIWSGANDPTRSFPSNAQALP
jgi:hypothetical protein